MAVPPEVLWLSVGRIAQDRAGHAVAAAAAAAELLAADGDDLDAGLAQQRVGVGVAVVADDHARLERDDVVAVVPLLALGVEGVAAGADDQQVVEPQRLLVDVEEMALLLA